MSEIQWRAMAILKHLKLSEMTELLLNILSSIYTPFCGALRWVSDTILKGLWQPLVFNRKMTLAVSISWTHASTIHRFYLMKSLYIGYYNSMDMYL